MLPCCSAGDTENMYLRPQSHDIASSLITACPLGKKVGLLLVSPHYYSTKIGGGEQLKNKVLYGVLF